MTRLTATVRRAISNQALVDTVAAVALFIHATAPDANHIASVSAQVLEYDSVKVATITDFLPLPSGSGAT